MSTKSPGSGKSDAAAVPALAGLTLLFFWKIALTNRVLTGLDLFTYFYPYRDFVAEALRAGRLPLWNPYLFMGAPLLANSQAAVLYPLHWPLLWLSTPKQIAWSIVLHIWLAGAGSYLFARRALGLRPLPSFAAAAVFALGGFLGAQVEHVNQLNASAWLPWLLLCVAEIGRLGNWEAGKQVLGGGAIVGLMLLAGHTQAAYIVLLGAGVYALIGGIGTAGAQRMRRSESTEKTWDSPRRRRERREKAYESCRSSVNSAPLRCKILGSRPFFRGVRSAFLRAFGPVVALAAMVLLGLLLAAGQLLPTLELSRLSVRSGGLPYKEAASFSLKPTLIFKAFLPPLAWSPPFSEYVAYVGLIGLALAAVGAWAVLKKKRPGGAMPALALVGLFLAFGAYNPVYYLLYRIVPGFALFRAPARWLLLYSFGAAMLAGIGLDMLAGWTLNRPSAPAAGAQRTPSKSLRVFVVQNHQVLILLLLVAELFLAGRKLAYNHPTAPAAYDSLRTAPAHLLADAAFGGEPFRFLSMSDIRYDPGDMADLQAMYADQLNDDEMYALIVATKLKEVLAYNLPLRYRLFSVDGYDGGLLPIKDYVTLERLFLAEDEIWPDGRLRQQLRRIPPARLLALLNVKYVITDKTRDAWIDGVFYDLEHTVPLGRVTLTDIPPFETTHLGVVSYLTGTAELPDGTPLARLTITDTQGAVIGRTLRAGEQTAEGLAEIELRSADAESVLPARIGIRSLLPDGVFRLRGLTLIDERDGTFRSLSVDPNFEPVHSGDVKIYRNLSVLPRAFLVRRARVLPNAEEALAALRDPAFDPAEEVVLAEGEALDAPGGQGSVEMVSYEAERVELNVRLDGPGYLVLTDTYYPGWEATVDGEPVPLRRVDLYFRAVRLDAGEHRVVFRFRSAPVRWGLGVSAAAWLLWGAAVAIALLHSGRMGASGV